MRAIAGNNKAPANPNSNRTGGQRPGANPNGSTRTGNRGSAESLQQRQQQQAATGQPRKIVGQYMLGKSIGEGTFGKVKLAVHLPTGEKVAVKILEKSRIKEQADVRRVNREIKILKKSRHRNIIQLYEVLDTQNSIYLIMEHCEGGEMFDYIVKHKHVPETQACKFLHQIIDGVDLLHRTEVTHRDLKPENLLLKASTDGWLVKIVDFGLSNTHEGGKLLSTACGSPCYAAPEMIAGKKYVGPMADIWSLGVILFALVCGYLPFEDQNTAVLYKKILAGDYKPAKWISADVRDLIRRILETDPTLRYTVDDIRKHRWYKQVSEEQVPKELLSDTDAASLKIDVLNRLREQQPTLDLQVLEIELLNKMCNSNTAMYYLTETRAKQERLDQLEKSKNVKVHVAPTAGEVNTASAADKGQNRKNSPSMVIPAFNHNTPRAAVVGAPAMGAGAGVGVVASNNAAAAGASESVGPEANQAPAQAPVVTDKLVSTISTAVTNVTSNRSEWEAQKLRQQEMLAQQMQQRQEQRRQQQQLRQQQQQRLQQPPQRQTPGNAPDCMKGEQVTPNAAAAAAGLPYLNRDRNAAVLAAQKQQQQIALQLQSQAHKQVQAQGRADIHGEGEQGGGLKINGAASPIQPKTQGPPVPTRSPKSGGKGAGTGAGVDGGKATSTVNVNNIITHTGNAVLDNTNSSGNATGTDTSAVAGANTGGVVGLNVPRLMLQGIGNPAELQAAEKLVSQTSRPGPSNDNRQVYSGTDANANANTSITITTTTIANAGSQSARAALPDDAPFDFSSFAMGGMALFEDVRAVDDPRDRNHAAAISKGIADSNYIGGGGDVNVTQAAPIHLGGYGAPVVGNMGMGIGMEGMSINGVGADIGERPGTRRSRHRNRGGDAGHDGGGVPARPGSAVGGMHVEREQGNAQGENVNGRRTFVDTNVSTESGFGTGTVTGAGLISGGVSIPTATAPQVPQRSNAYKPGGGGGRNSNPGRAGRHIVQSAVGSGNGNDHA